MDKKAETLATYNTQATAMAEKFDRLGARTQDIEEAFARLLMKSPQVLELGCGNGRDATAILRHTNKYLGIDLSEALIALARKNVPEAQFEVADIETYEFPRTFDCIFAFASLLHSNKKQLEELFKRAYEVLSPRGIFVLSLKAGPYEEKRIVDELGARTFYYYEAADIREITPQFTILQEETRDLRGQLWLEMTLVKSR